MRLLLVLLALVVAGICYNFSFFKASQSEEEAAYLRYSKKTYMVRDAIVDGDVEQLRKMLDEGFSADAHYLPSLRDGRLISLAASYKQYDIIRLLAERGADLDPSGRFKRTPLVFAVAAATSDYDKTALLLIELGADVNTTDFYGNSTLLLAAYGSQVEVARALVEKGATINSPRNRDLRTPLMAAAEAGCKEIVELLLKNGADKTLVDNKKMTAFEIATDPEIKELLKD